MSVYFITGRLGSGKTLAAVGRIAEYLRQGRRVASNLDLRLEHLRPLGSRDSVLRLPDKPRPEDFRFLGFGCPERDYSGRRFGALVLDELGTWLNSRSWQDRERSAVLDWMLHARKYRWDVFLIVQDIGAVDAQLRDALCEYQMHCRNIQTLPVPLLGTLLRLLGIRLVLPKGSVATTFYGQQRGVPLDRKWYRGAHLFEAYDTGQVFQSGFEPVGDSMVDMRACSSSLSAWHLRGRYMVRRSFWSHVEDYIIAAARLVTFVAATVAGRSPAAVARRFGLSPVTVPLDNLRVRPAVRMLIERRGRVVWAGRLEK